MNWLLLKNSLLVSGGATLLALGLGLAAALAVAGLPRPWNKAALAGSILALALPPFVVTNCWLFLLGPTGVWKSWLPFEIMSLAGTVWTLGLMLWPIPMLSVLAAWNRLEPQWLEADMALRGGRLIWNLLLPLAQGALAQVAALTFILAFNNFAVPAILQVSVYPAQAWIRFNTSFDAAGTLRLSLPMLFVPLMLLWWFARRGVAWPHIQPAASPRLLRRQLGTWWIAAVVCTVVLSGVAVLLPVFQLMGTRRVWTELPGAIAAGQPALWGSLGLAFAAASFVVLLGLAARSGGFKPHHDARASMAGRLVALLVWVPFLLPGVLLGIALIKIFNQGWLTAIYSSVWIVIVAYAIRYLAPGQGVIAETLKRVDSRLREVARLEGASRWQTLRQVEWPQVAPGVAAAWYVVFVLCLWDVESMILVVPPGVETLALRIFNLLHYGHNPQVDALCLMLLGLALAPLALWAAGGWLRKLWFRNSSRWLGAVSLCSVALALLLFAGCAPAGSGPGVKLSSGIFDSVSVLGSRGTGVGQLNKPRSVAVDRQDNLYVVDMTGRVQKFSSNGVFLLSWQMPQTDLGKPKGMCRDGAGNIVVLEPHYARVNCFSPEGKLVAQWGAHGTNDGMLSVPRSVAVNERDEIFVTEYQQTERVQKFVWDKSASNSKAPRWVMSFGKPGNGPGEFSRPEGMCVDGQGLVYVADSCNHRVQVFTADGRFVRAYGKPGRGPGELSYPYDVCVDAAGRQYVCEFGNSRIQVFDAQGRPLEIIGGPGGEPGRFSNPWGVALDSEGNLYVADSQNHRVQKLVHSRKDQPRQLATPAPSPAANGVMKPAA